MSGWRDAQRDVAERVEALLADLSDAEVHRVMLGDFEPFTSRGVPEPHYVDAGTGLRGVDGATAFPAGIALAASFDEDLAQRYGAAVGAEARRAGFTVLLGPTVDLARDPVGGRVAEAFGEDPHLAGRMGAAHVRGAQGQGVITQVKHYVAYNGEKRRTGHGLEPNRGDSMNAEVPESQLHDVYLRPFEACVRAGAWSMMGSYNRLGGRYVCQSPEILDLPRRLWGWRGFYCPDFIFAVRDPAEALAAGLDLGALGGDGGRTEEMVSAADPEALRAAVGNIARAVIAVGLVDHPPRDAVAPSCAAHQELAYRTCLAGSVLLKNDGLLPLTPSLRIALLGAAHQGVIYVGGGAASVSLTPERVISPRDAILAQVDTVVTSQGSVGDVALPIIPAEVFSLPDGTGPGVAVEFTDGHEAWVGTLPHVDHAVDPSAPGKAWPRRWRSKLTPRVTGPHRLSLVFGGAARLRLDGVEILAGSRETELFIDGPHYPMQAVVDLTAGHPVALEIDYEPGPAITIPPMGLGPTLRLGWQEPDDRLDRAAAAAAAAEVAVVFVTAAAGEGMDRDHLRLPGDQEELIRRVAQENPRTLVVLNTPGPVDVDWADAVAAVLQVWYPGERYGEALAAMLFGDEEPGGRLPLTFPRRREDLPGAVAPGEVPTDLDYGADGGIGYRAPAVVATGAAFPFGYGLGYARTECDVTASELPGGATRLRLRVRNLGDRDTTHVAQVYAQFEGERQRELVAFRRIPVPAGGQASAEVVVRPEDLARWDPTAQSRVPVPGRHLLRVATDAADSGYCVAFPVAGD